MPKLVPRVLACLVFAAVLGAATFVRFYDPVRVDPANTLRFRNFSTDNLMDEEALPDGVRWRWALGPRTTIRFDLDRDRPLLCRLELSSPLAGQHLRVLANGLPVAEQDMPAPHRWPDERLALEVPFPGREGPNEIVLEFARWSGRDGVFLSDKDRRPFAVNLFVLGFAEGRKTP